MIRISYNKRVNFESVICDQCLCKDESVLFVSIAFDRIKTVIGDNGSRVNGWLIGRTSKADMFVSVTLKFFEWWGLMPDFTDNANQCKLSSGTRFAKLIYAKFQFAAIHQLILCDYSVFSSFSQNYIPTQSIMYKRISSHKSKLRKK